MTPDDIVKRLRAATRMIDMDHKAVKNAVDLIERQAKALEEARDLSWFWKIVDQTGLNNVCSDERGALAELVRMAAHNTRKAKALEEAEKALDNVSSRARMQDSDGAQVNVDNYHLKEARRALATIRAARGEKEDG